MVEHKATAPEGTFQLPITGQRNGKRHIVVGHAVVLDDEFTQGTLLRYCWNFHGAGYAHGALRREHPRGPRSDHKRRPPEKRVLLHQIVFEHYHGGLPNGLVIDHIDRNPLNNLPGNLRAATRSINGANGGKSLRNTSGFRGVSWCSTKQRWRASIRCRNRYFYFGYHNTLEEAARAVNSAYRKHYPEIPIPNPAAEV